MLTKEYCRKQILDLTPYTEEQLEYLITVINLIRFPWVPFSDGNVNLVLGKHFFGTAYILHIDNLCYMSNSPLDLLDHRSIFDKAEGDILLTGLGLGLGILLANLNPKVKSITVLENNPIILKHIVPMLLPECVNVVPTFIECDANIWSSTKEFDFAYIDHAYVRACELNFIDTCKHIVVWFDECERVRHQWQ